MSEQVMGGETVDPGWEIGRGGIRIPHLPAIIESPREADDYVVDFWRENSALSSDDELVIPAGEDKPAVVIRIVSESHKVPAGPIPDGGGFMSQPYTAFYRTIDVLVPPTEQAGKFKNFLRARCNASSRIPMYSMYLNGRYCSNPSSPKFPLPDTEPDPTFEEALQAFVDLLRD